MKRDLKLYSPPLGPFIEYLHNIVTKHTGKIKRLFKNVPLRVCY